jgi:hypothetical protein
VCTQSSALNAHSLAAAAAGSSPPDLEERYDRPMNADSSDAAGPPPQ